MKFDDFKKSVEKSFDELESVDNLLEEVARAQASAQKFTLQKKK